MIEVPLVTIERVAGVTGTGEESLKDLVFAALDKLGPVEEIGGVIAATFSNPERFPALAVRVANKLKLSSDTPAFDLQMACSAYPYGVYLAGRLSADTGKKILLIDGDCQTPLVDKGDHATGGIFSDAATVSVISSDRSSPEKSFFAFLSREDEALKCAAEGPIKMDGMKVFSFVATEVRELLKGKMADFFIPHQANPYMVRQLAKSLGLGDKLLTLDERLKNPGSSSIPLTIAAHHEALHGMSALIAGFGAGYSAAVAKVKIL